MFPMERDTLSHRVTTSKLCLHSNCCNTIVATRFRQPNPWEFTILVSSLFLPSIKFEFGKRVPNSIIFLDFTIYPLQTMILFHSLRFTKVAICIEPLLQVIHKIGTFMMWPLYWVVMDAYSDRSHDTNRRI